MLLTITTTHKPATDIGFLLHKNPDKVHTFSCSFGLVYLFYPEATEDRCTVALLLDINPVNLSRKEKGNDQGFALKPYVNDRAYVASSFMSVAFIKLFSTLFSGRSKHRQELVEQDFPLEVTVDVLPCRGGSDLLRRLFEPLGYELKITEHALDDHFPEWGKSPYYSVTFRRICPLREFLIHLYVLIPVLDDDKHYWISDDECEKLLRYGKGWLEKHPEKELIASRYLRKFRSLVNQALEQLTDGEEPEPAAQELSAKTNLTKARYAWVLECLKKQNASQVLDLGCGEGKLIGALFDDASFQKITGCDVSTRALGEAKRLLKWDKLSDLKKKKISLIQGALTYKDDRFVGYDAATLVEVIEHLDDVRLETLKQVVFAHARPGCVIITTPNAEYNVLFDELKAGGFRHSDHRFEWTRDQFQQWALACAQQFGYDVTFDGIGDEDKQYGFPTQAGVFTRHG